MPLCSENPVPCSVWKPVAPAALLCSAGLHLCSERWLRDGRTRDAEEQWVSVLPCWNHSFSEWRRTLPSLEFWLQQVSVWPWDCLWLVHVLGENRREKYGWFLLIHHQLLRTECFWRGAHSGFPAAVLQAGDAGGKTQGKLIHCWGRGPLDSGDCPWPGCLLS